MKIIDFHTHFFPDKMFDAIWRWFETRGWPIEYKRYADDLVDLLTKKGVSRAVSLHYPHKEGMARSLNEFTFQLGEKYPNFLIPFGSVHPDDTDSRQILTECFEKFGFKGIKIHCHVQHVAPDDPRMEPIYDVCNEHKKIVLIHCGSGPHFLEQTSLAYGYDVRTVSGVRKMEKALKKYPDIRFVIPHLGYEQVEETFGMLSDHPNLYLDTTMAISNYFPVEVRPEWLKGNADRILFGTDFPNLPYPWERERDILLTMGLGKDVEEKIFYRNAAKLLDIKI